MAKYYVPIFDDLSFIVDDTHQIIGVRNGDIEKIFATGGGGSGVVNLSTSSTGTDYTITNDSGTNATIAQANSTKAGVLSAADKNKLDGIAAGATVNSTDGELRDRSTHTGSQLAITISDLVEAVQDIVAASLVQGTNMTVSYNDSTGEITLSAIDSTVTNTTNLTFSTTSTTVTVLSDTGTDAILPAATTSTAGVMSAADKAKLNDIAAGATANAGDSYLLDRANHTGSQAIASVTGLQTALDAKAGLTTDNYFQGVNELKVTTATGGATFTPNMADRIQRVTTDQNVTIAAPTGAPASGKFRDCFIYLIYGGAHTVSLNAAYKYAGTPPAFSSASGKYDILYIFHNGNELCYELKAGFNV